MIVKTTSTDHTMKIGERLARKLKQGDILLLTGDLGAGKTTFTKGIAKGLAITDHVTSPSFTIMSQYPGEKVYLYHFDLYRIEDSEEFLELGLTDFLYGNGVSVVEWSEKLEEYPDEYLSIDIKLDPEDAESRLINFTPQGSHFKEILEKLSQEVF
ncbi:tRNA (adenosine(37)-N6)-threonylcarbamoyltransferase complex ATPase subunit type 1 TsaE [Natranaerobius trueperi]|uniref:tRNA threonylcarbamoyladenosine biosynthesis protein TsaE n=1 Tax=Natranaerobius trueperi TaxID=759412 RepID=A0A226C0W5_9FIRM|nr:tRNA (adenosine(37)-N6)-threonylcarbamoyltransferase complex ATPase subunit type 1 TsaE [Natranaerobius trueperi]OWZ84801.1 tRNA (adenosine(37)-N6)-threonylcarbamoyltransferase complex ATPase subunit type 1 TsaE [Natranaerobius trueperi]